VFFSSAFGLRIAANRPIPGLRSLAPRAAVDVHIEFGAMPRHRRGARAVHTIPPPAAGARRGPALRVFRPDGDEYFHIRSDDGTEFLIDPLGQHVWATWLPQSTLEDVTTYLLGPIAGFVLRLRGVVCLHASAVALRGRAVVLLGPSEAGKSTTAAAFARLGFPVLSDDIVALSERNGRLPVQPGSPRLRLWPESVGMLFGEAGALPRLTPTWDKCYLDLRKPPFRFARRPLPLGAVYVLGDRRDDSSAPSVRALAVREGFVALLGNTYGHWVSAAAMRAKEFAVLGQVMSSVPVRAVTPHLRPDYLPDLCRVIRDDFHRLAGLPAPESCDAAC
jgi:hypothetical protein